ncbi:ATP-binding cassette domain-containing protein [Actinosynnema sp. NPDC020468]|uniref:ATP-binding cassette domain-containing protein n=1 Tax=Actinosynnema sp. NPDC020468 TaxID=3154488 RepID=UPI0033F0D218
MLEATGLHRSFRLPRRRVFERAARRHAVRDVSLSLHEGGRLGVVGESGSGKSTLLRLLLGLDRPDSGSVSYRGRSVAGRDLAWFRREAQVVLQDPFSSLNPRHRVREIVAEPLECLEVPGDHAARTAEVLTSVGLDPDVVTRYPHEFSGGQRQRIALARALAPRPRVLFADEPFSALDATVRTQVVDLVRGLVDEFGLSLVLVSHDLGVVRELCDRLLVLKDGVVVEQGATTDVLAHPEHPYTRALLDAVPRLPEVG